MSKKLFDTTLDPDMKEMREKYEYTKQQTREIRAEAAIDMQYVKGNPFTEEELDEREDRPTIAPEEMSQYRNQVTNSLRGNPRGVKFQPNGGGASPRTAEFYQGKMREIEYASHAIEHYIGAAENVLQRSYGALRVKTEWESPRSPNQVIRIEGFPDPDVVLVDTDAKRRTSEDMKYAWVLEPIARSEFRKKYGKTAKIVDFDNYAGRYPDWLLSSKQIQLAEYWQIETTERQLWAVVMATLEAPQPGTRQRVPRWVVQQKPLFVFDDELEAIRGAVARSRGQAKIASLRKQRMVDYPTVTMQITNGLEVLHEEDWKGKYIPIVTMYGPILYVPEKGSVKKTILSMTRFGRAPWKAFCYACSQELEVLGMVPHGSVVAEEGQLGEHEQDWEDSLHSPKLVLKYKARIPGMPADMANLPPPGRLSYTQGEYLQSIELVKEGYRRSIQAAMGSNFLPTSAQKVDDKSGTALEKIDQVATKGTYHFVDAYEDGIRHVGVICEDLIDKIHDYTGETGIMSGKLESSTVRINDAKDPEAYSTRGDHLVTVSTAPSSDSEYEAVEAFLERLMTNLDTIAKIAGPKAAAAMLAHSIKMRNLGAMGDELADIIMPEEFKTKDGKPPDPRLAAAQQQIAQLTQELQKLGMVVQTKQIEGHIKYSIEKMRVQATSADKAADRAVKLDVAAIQAKIETMAMVLEELKRIGGLNEDASQRLHDAGQATLTRAHDAVERTKDRIHDHHTQQAEHVAAAASQAAGAVTDAQGRAQQAGIDAQQQAAEAAQTAAEGDTGGGGGQ